ncbi:MAG: hypothetical protein H6707_09060 [Deltaproteobacteria bacterium]|nr:hypothetical protein [Deltaproteobacteria bacterium]
MLKSKLTGSAMIVAMMLGSTALARPNQRQHEQSRGNRMENNSQRNTQVRSQPNRTHVVPQRSATSPGRQYRPAPVYRHDVPVRRVVRSVPAAVYRPRRTTVVTPARYYRPQPAPTVWRPVYRRPLPGYAASSRHSALTFRRLDRNADRMLSWFEVRGHGYTPLAFRRADRNNDGLLSLVEAEFLF